ncbi:HNH endonuclease signature motif containing protein [Minwuia sp. IMCC4030]|uniref:HNH endonuclease n=1 Tax=Minwuia sp. IMCC4030 TaxID=3040677 RepID=UPI002479C06D|nr:HNH endonuclease signature motif containing protein [Minwuia sp. IMCC4030]
MEFDMTKYSFKYRERFSVFSTHGPKCYLCKEPIDFQSMHVDHIIPEALLDDKEELERVVLELGLPEDFEVNSYENWMPSCAGCNLKKGQIVFKKSLMVQTIIQIAAEKAKLARTFENEAISNYKLSRSINTICRAVEGDDISLEKISPIIVSIVKNNPELAEGIYKIIGGGDGNAMGLTVREHIPAQIPLTPTHTVIMEDEWKIVVSTPYGIGYAPKGHNVDRSFYCGNCGSLGPWNGARCLTCGFLNDDRGGPTNLDS